MNDLRVSLYKFFSYLLAYKSVKTGKIRYMLYKYILNNVMNFEQYSMKLGTVLNTNIILCRYGKMKV